MRPIRHSRLFAFAIALLLLVPATLRAQDADAWKQKFAVVEQLMNEEIPEGKKAELTQRWAVILENARRLREAEHEPMDDAFRARLAAVQEAEDQSRRSPSSTISSGRNEGLDNWKRADALVTQLVASGEPITKDKLLAINTELRRSNGTDQVYAGGRNQALAVPDAHADEALDGFFTWLRDAETKLDPIELAARVYQRLVTIHPLQDANGRSSRLLMDWVLEKAGLPAVALDHSVATSAISDPFVFHGTVEQYSGRPLKVIENLTQNLERGIKTKLEALGKTWTTVVKAVEEDLPLPKKEHETVTKTSATDAVPGAILDASGGDAAAIARAQAARTAALGQEPRTGITEVLKERTEEGHEAERGVK